ESAGVAGKLADRKEKGNSRKAAIRRNFPAPGTAAVVGSSGEEEVVDGREVAAAWAAGIALRIRSEDPKLGPDEVKKRIIGKAWRRRGRYRGVMWGGEGRG